MDQTRKIKVLLVEDDPYDAELFSELLDSEGTAMDLRRTSGLSSALSLLAGETFDVIVTDLGLPDCKGIVTFLRLHSMHPHIPVIVLTGMNDEETAIKAVQKGAQDYLVKGQISGNLLVRSIRYSIERQRLITELEKSLREIRTLRGLIPMCAWCRKIRDDKGYWKKVETYIEEQTGAAFTHGICPKCMQTINPGLFERLMRENPEILQDQDSSTDRQNAPSEGSP